MSLDLSKPVVWTSKGNLNADDLEYRVDWEVSEQAIVCVETYTEKSTGEIVRQSRHGLLKQGAGAGVEQALLG